MTYKKPPIFIIYREVGDIKHRLLLIKRAFAYIFDGLITIVTLGKWGTTLTINCTGEILRDNSRLRNKKCI